MHKELLAYLLGYRGSFLVVDTNGNWNLHESLPVDAGTKYLCEEILHLGQIAGSIREFVDSVRAGAVTVGVKRVDQLDSIINTSDKVYSSALCDGIEEVMLSYENTINILYRDAGSPGMSVAQIRSGLSEWFEIIPTISNVIQEVLRRPAQILTTLDTAIRFGAARQHLLTILKKCNTVFLRHISIWVVWGTLPQQSGFFVENTSGNSEEVTAELVPLFLPSFVPSQLAKTILAIGRYSRKMAIHPLLSEDAFVLQRCLVSEEVLGSGQLNITLLEDLLMHAEQIVGFTLWTSVYNGIDLLASSTGEIEAAIPLRQHLDAIGDYLMCFRGDFWRTFTTSALEVVTKFAVRSMSYRGGIVDLRQAARVRDNIVARFNMAAATHGNIDHKCFKFVSFTCKPDDTAYAKLLEPMASDTTDSLESIRISNFILATTKSMQLNYSLPSPVNTLICEQCHAMLQSIFNHTMYLLFTEIMLSSIWVSCMAVSKRVSRESRRGLRGDENVMRGALLLKPLLILRRKMKFFMDNLKLYIMTDVIHTQFVSLQSDLKETKTFDGAKSKIKNCLQGIAEDAFLVDRDKSNHMVLLTIRLAVRCCLQLWYVVQHSLELDGRSDDYYRAMITLSKKASVITDISHAFDRHVRDLYEILSQNTQVNKYRQLLTRLNFNHYYGG